MISYATWQQGWINPKYLTWFHKKTGTGITHIRASTMWIIVIRWITVILIMFAFLPTFSLTLFKTEIWNSHPVLVLTVHVIIVLERLLYFWVTKTTEEIINTYLSNKVHHQWNMNMMSFFNIAIIQGWFVKEMKERCHLFC